MREERVKMPSWTSRHCTGHTRWPTGWSLEGGGTEHTQPSWVICRLHPKGWRVSSYDLTGANDSGSAQDSFFLQLQSSTFTQNTCLISEMLQ